jgi:Gluconate 2-dehydrogenase subunit 3
MHKYDLPRVSRRVAVKWMLTATASLTLLRNSSFGAETNASGTPASTLPAAGSARERGPKGYGTDPELLNTYKPGDFWPLTMNDQQRRTTAALCDVIIPEDEHSPSAAKIGVPDFIDEWISAPYPNHDSDRELILRGLAWMDAEAGKRFGKAFADLEKTQMTEICDDICFLGTATQEFIEPTKFFTLFRNLTAGGFYTTPEGMADLRYVGNRPLVSFDGPPIEALKKVGLA